MDILDNRNRTGNNHNRTGNNRNGDHYFTVREQRRYKQRRGGL